MSDVAIRVLCASKVLEEKKERKARRLNSIASMCCSRLWSTILAVAKLFASTGGKCKYQNASMDYDAATKRTLEV